MPTYSRVRSIGWSNGVPCQPSATWGPETPSPSRNRPPLRWSSVSAAMAAAAGVRPAIWSTPVPMPMRSVRAAIQAARMVASEPHVSDVHTESNPARSASTASSATSFGRPTQCPTWMPIRTRGGYPSGLAGRALRGAFDQEGRDDRVLALVHAGVNQRPIRPGLLREHLGVSVQHRRDVLAAPRHQDRDVDRAAGGRALDPLHQAVEVLARHGADRERVAVDPRGHARALRLGEAVALVQRQHLGDPRGADLREDDPNRVDLVRELG